ncbi:putative membrane protein [Oopsacas minuta]|uniref:Membrane protein n=1 Tax=Oopsacas minuta TaxID=111878 RepID=A0AAV7KKR6_9METZ|nr:putative membrane protein [Oopsacas minuta]
MTIRFPIEIFPLAMVFFPIIGLITTYGISVGLNHTIPVVPFISNTGNFPPESGIFTIVLSCTAFLILLVISIQFKHIWDNTEKKGACSIIIHIINVLSYCAGLISVLGSLMVGSYTSADSRLGHELGADLTLVFGIVYFMLQTPIAPFVEPKLKIIRWIILVIRIALIVFSLAMLLVYLIPTGNLTVSTVAQWFLVSTLFVMFGTFLPEFHALDVQFKVGIKKKAGEETIRQNGTSFRVGSDAKVETANF